MRSQGAASRWKASCRLLAVATTISAQAWSQPIEFTAANWDLANAEVKQYLGRRALIGSASLKGASFHNGVIEFDLAAEHRRSYPGVLFRVQDDGNYERVYFRPHRSGHYADAIQYLPAFRGADSWQLYNGKGYTAGVTLPVYDWVHVRLEVMGTQARVFVGKEARPVLVIDDLKRGVSRGGLALMAPHDGSTHFSNFSYTSTNDLQFGPPPAVVSPAGVITEWALSQGFRPEQVDAEETPDAQRLEVRWQRVKAEPSGLLDISRYVKAFAGTTSCVFARTTLHAEKKEVRRLAFGYSDAVTLILNGRPLYRGSSAYRERDSSFLGAIGLHDSVYLPLEAGENELIAVIWERMGGWGLMARELSETDERGVLGRLRTLLGTSGK